MAKFLDFTGDAYDTVDGQKTFWLKKPKQVSGNAFATINNKEIHHQVQGIWIIDPHPDYYATAFIHWIGDDEIQDSNGDIDDGDDSDETGDAGDPAGIAPIYLADSSTHRGCPWENGYAERMVKLSMRHILVAVSLGEWLC